MKKLFKDKEDADKVVSYMRDGTEETQRKYFYGIVSKDTKSYNN